MSLINIVSDPETAGKKWEIYQDLGNNQYVVQSRDDPHLFGLTRALWRDPMITIRGWCGPACNHDWRNADEQSRSTNNAGRS